MHSDDKKRARLNLMVALVDSLPPLAAASSDSGSDPRLVALFASPEHMRKVFGNSPSLRESRAQQADTGQGAAPAPCWRRS